MSKPDTLFHNALIVTVDGESTIIEKGALTVKDGMIENILATAAGDSLPEAKESFDCKGNLLMPGLVNAHTHLPMSLFRGLADDLSLDRWLQDYIFPVEAKYISPSTVRLGTRLSVAEMLLNGTTTCCDGYFFALEVAETVSSSGMRAVVGQGVIDFPAPGVPDPSHNVTHAKAFAENWNPVGGQVQPSIFCHSPYTCSAQTLQAAKAAANQLGVLFQIHAAETNFEVQQCRDANGCSPVKYLSDLDILDSRTLLVHAVWVDAADIELIAGSGARIAHCPESNLKLASGIAPLPDFINAGVVTGLGTDGCASNNDLDLFGEMDTAAKIHKARRQDPSLMDAATVLRMATIEGARALGLDQQTGSLEIGKQADLIVLDIRQPHLMPCYNPVSHLVYAARGSDVLNVMIAGRWVVQDRQLITMDLSSLLDEIETIGRQISSGIK